MIMIEGGTNGKSGIENDAHFTKWRYIVEVSFNHHG